MEEKIINLKLMVANLDLSVNSKEKLYSQISKISYLAEQKENIIKEVREYIENNKIYTNEKQEAYTLKNTWYGLELLGILDKENI